MIDLEAIFGEPDCLPKITILPTCKPNDDQANAAEAATRAPTVRHESNVVQLPDTSNAKIEATAARHSIGMKNCDAVRDDEPNPFADWILRPDVDGRMGWEPADLPESARWWSRFRI